MISTYKRVVETYRVSAADKVEQHPGVVTVTMRACRIVHRTIARHVDH